VSLWLRKQQLSGVIDHGIPLFVYVLDEIMVEHVSSY
jgi:hypothetical protein